MQSVISASEYLLLTREKPSLLLDVRAEGEFAKGFFPGSVNGPILNDQERHEVGIHYKQKGRDSAIAFGKALIPEAVQRERTEAWKQALASQNPKYLTCFRGGLRSRFAQEWLATAGVETIRISGGYKALRAELSKQIGRTRNGIIVSGLTGTGKTTFLQSLKDRRAIDLEQMAVHRGSAFGPVIGRPQPTQQNFENHLGLGLWQSNEQSPLLFESESRLIGRCVIPEALFAQLREMPRLELEATMEERVKNLFLEYVTLPLEKNSVADLLKIYEANLLGIRNRLGGKDHDSILTALHLSFRRSTQRWQDHQPWIESLLVRYYDPLYLHAQSKRNGNILLSGTAEELRAWLRTNHNF